jgi:hypothetical protein
MTRNAINLQRMPKSESQRCCIDINRRAKDATNVRQGERKVKLSLCLTKHHAMKAYWRSGGIAPRILDLGTRWRWVVIFTPQPFYPQRKSPWYPLARRLGGPRQREGTVLIPVTGTEQQWHIHKEQQSYRHCWGLNVTMRTVLFKHNMACSCYKLHYLPSCNAERFAAKSRKLQIKNHLTCLSVFVWNVWLFKLSLSRRR